MTATPTLADGIALLPKWPAPQIAEALRVPEAMVQAVLDDPAHAFAILPIEKCRTVPMDFGGLDPGIVAYVDQQYRAHKLAVQVDVSAARAVLQDEMDGIRTTLRLLDTWIQNQGGNFADDWRRMKVQAEAERRARG